MNYYYYILTGNHTSTSPLIFYRPDALPTAQPTASKHWRHKHFARKLVVIIKFISETTL